MDQRESLWVGQGYTSWIRQMSQKVALWGKELNDSRKNTSQLMETADLKSHERVENSIST